MNVDSSLRTIPLALRSLWIGLFAFAWAAGFAASLALYRSPLGSDPLPFGLPGMSLSDRVVIIVVDGLPFDTACDPSSMPYLVGLAGQGAWARMRVPSPSLSAPGYATLLTGAWPDLNDGPAVNIPSAWFRAPTQDTLFAAVHRAGGRTALAAYHWFGLLTRSSDVDEDWLDTAADKQGDARILAAATEWVKRGGQELVLIHLSELDDTGHHLGGPGSAAWTNAARNVDREIRALVEWLDLRSDTLLVTSDHGHIAGGGHGGPEESAVTGLFLLAGAFVRPGGYADVELTDVAPTAAALLGAPLPASAQGRALEEMLNAAPASESLARRSREQKRNLWERYTAAIGVAGWPAPADETAAGYTQAMVTEAWFLATAGRIARLAILLVLAVPILIALRRSGWTPGLTGLASAGAFGIAFHAVYAIAFGHTYSLSGFTSWAGALTSILVGSLAGFLAAWMTGSGLNKLSGWESDGILRMAGRLTGVLAVPVGVNFLWNGPLVSWMIPEMWTAFTGVLALFWIFLVTGYALLFAGFFTAWRSLRKSAASSIRIQRT